MDRKSTTAASPRVQTGRGPPNREVRPGVRGVAVLSRPPRRVRYRLKFSGTVAGSRRSIAESLKKVRAPHEDENSVHLIHGRDAHVDGDGWGPKLEKEAVHDPLNFPHRFLVQRPAKLRCEGPQVVV